LWVPRASKPLPEQLRMASLAISSSCRRWNKSRFGGSSSLYKAKAKMVAKKKGEELSVGLGSRIDPIPQLYTVTIVRKATRQIAGKTSYVTDQLV